MLALGQPVHTDQDQLLPVLCQGLPGMNYRPMCRWLLLMLQTEASCFYCQAWGHISRRTGHAKRPDATCLGFVNLWEILGSSQHEPRQAVCMEKALELAWWPTSWVEQNLRNHHGRAKNDSHIDGDSDLMPPPCWLCVRRARRTEMTSVLCHHPICDCHL